MLLEKYAELETSYDNVTKPNTILRADLESAREALFEKDIYIYRYEGPEVYERIEQRTLNRSIHKKSGHPRQYRHAHQECGYTEYVFSTERNTFDVKPRQIERYR